MLTFVTGNKNKFREASIALDPVVIQQLDADLDEIQELDSRIILAHKIGAARKLCGDSFLVEDSSLHMEVLGGTLPGPLVKWFLQSMGIQKLADLADSQAMHSASARTVIGYSGGPGEMLFFEGSTAGTIVQPRGDYDFGYDQIFVPDGQSLTLSELKVSGNFSFSPRARAMAALKEFLLGKN